MVKGPFGIIDTEKLRRREGVEETGPIIRNVRRYAEKKVVERRRDTEGVGIDFVKPEEVVEERKRVVERRIEKSKKIIVKEGDLSKREILDYVDKGYTVIVRGKYGVTMYYPEKIRAVKEEEILRL